MSRISWKVILTIVQGMIMEVVSVYDYGGG